MKFSAALGVFVALACLVLSFIGEGAAATVERAASARADTVKARKERVRKETAPPPAPVGKTETRDSATHEEGGFFSSCLGELLGSMLGSICSGSSAEVEEAPAVVEGADYHGAAHIQVISSEERAREGLPFQGMVATIDLREDSVDVWDRPGGDAAGGEIVCTLAEGTEVTATEFEYFQDGMWMHVEAAECGGWLRDKEIIPPTVEPPAARAVGMEESPPGAAASAPQREEVTLERSYREDPRWYVRGEVSYPSFEGEALREEYKTRNFEAGAEVGFFLTRSINIDLLFGYTHADGSPQYKYVGPTSTDWPLISDLYILGFGAQAGQMLTNSEGTVYFKYGLGPSVFSVKEEASIAVYEGETRTGTRTDELAEWKVGAEAVIEGGWIAARRIPIGGYIRFSWIPWKGNGEKSLTLDYLDSSSIFMFNFGISVGYLSF
jgi:hypothetical protein